MVLVENCHCWLTLLSRLAAFCVHWYERVCTFDNFCYCYEGYPPYDPRPYNEFRRYPRTILLVCVLYTLVTALPATVIFLYNWTDVPVFHPVQFFVCYCDWWLVPASLAMVLSIFPVQIFDLTTRRVPRGNSCLSPAFLVLQCVALLLLAWSSKRNLGKPGHPLNIVPPDPRVSRWIRYRRGDWQWMNYGILGAGQGLLALEYVFMM